MSNLMAAIGSLLVLLGFTTLIIATVRHFFPSFDQLMPESFMKGLSFTFAGYYTLAGLLLLYLT